MCSAGTWLGKIFFDDWTDGWKKGRMAAWGIRKAPAAGGLAVGGFRQVAAVGVGWWLAALTVGSTSRPGHD